MNKTIITLAITLLGFAGSSFGAATPSSDPVPAAIGSDFNQLFANARDAQWEQQKNFFKVTFEDRGQTLFAFFAGNGDLMGVASNQSSASLPEMLRASIRTSWSGYWITDLFSFCNADEKGFVVTLENADKVVVLKAVDHGGWSVYRTTEKK